ncbi:MAG: helix-turn-helix transcriptional regulator [Burkholderiales bacterium]
MSFAQRLLGLRRERGLTQQGLSDATGIHVQQIKRYEAGTSQPSAEALKRIAKSFAVTTDWLLFEDAERGPDDDLRLQFEALSTMSTEERAIARAVLDAMIIKSQVTGALERVNAPASSTTKGKKPARERVRA